MERAIKLRDLLDEPVFGGAHYGEDMLASLISKSRDLDESRLFLDFRGVEVATTSFLRASVLAFRSFCRESLPANAIVLANLVEAVKEEASFLLSQTSDALVICDLTRTKISHARIIGKLEPKESEALSVVLAHSDAVDARIIAEHFGDDTGSGKRFTKWNNQLANLVKKGIVLEESDGRRKLYRPVLKELRNGS